jgi:uncharacterized protein YndB with AHSA1/START domain
MSDLLQIDSYGTLVGPDTLQIRRLLPGPIERVWDYITDGDLRRQWLAGGTMRAEAGEQFELVWRNDELTEPAGERPEGMPEEHRKQSEVVLADPPHKLVITWAGTGDVTFELKVEGSQVLLTLTHERFPTRSSILGHAAGWHVHLDLLEARAAGRQPEPYFWDRWRALREDYDSRVPADSGA